MLTTIFEDLQVEKTKRKRWLSNGGRRSMGEMDRDTPFWPIKILIQLFIP